MGKRKKQKVVKQEVEEFGGWTIGDIVWGIRPNGAVCRGEIKKFYKSESLAQVLCIEGDGYLICELSTLKENSTKSEMKKIAKNYLPKAC